LKEYDTVTLVSDLPGSNIKSGAIGIVLIVFEQPSLAYLVEFFDDNWTSLDTHIVNHEQISLRES
jgi:Domain of unknown function (DUF4926)